MVLNAFSAVFTIFLVGVLGFLLKRRGWVTDETAQVLPRFLTNIVIPPFLLRNVTTTFNHDQLLDLLSGCIIPFITIFLTYAVAVVCAYVFRVSEGRRNTFAVMFSSSNAMNIGLPICLALFGEEALPYALLYFFASTTSFWTYGNYLLAKDSSTYRVKLLSKNSFKQIFSPPLMGFMAGIVLVCIDVQLPAFVDKAFQYVGNMTIPVAIIYIGVLMCDVQLSDIRLERDTLLVFLGRFIVAPLVVLGVMAVLAAFPIFTVPPLMRNVYTIQASLPVMMNAAILVGFYKTDAKYAALLVSATTMMTLVTVPVWALILANIGG